MALAPDETLGTVPDARGDPTAPALASCAPPSPEPAGSVPADLAADLARRLADPRLSSQAVSLSVSVAGWGHLVAVDADQPLLPASNQKLLTAMGALEVLSPEGRFETRVLTAAPPTAGAVDGDLVLVAGGDPTLTGRDLDGLAAEIRAAGITEVRGALLVDESRYDSSRAAEGWLDWQRPTYAGSLSALIVDHNQYRGDPAFLDDPALVGAERFADALSRNGVNLRSPARHAVASDADGGVTIATHTSLTYAELISIMLRESDNMIAESLVREIGVQRRGDGSTEAGLAAIRESLRALCVPLNGTDHDGSGLSRANRRSADEWRLLLDAARNMSWWPQLIEGLPVAGRSGTLAGRLGGPATAGNVRAKTGSIIPGRALSGYAVTATGRDVVFSLVVNGDQPAPAQAALDDLLTAIVAHPG